MAPTWFLRILIFLSAAGMLPVSSARPVQKVTLLRCLNLLETPTTGEIAYHGTNIADKKVNAPQYRSKVGMVFQNFNLFNNMTVLENCIIGQTKRS